MSLPKAQFSQKVLSWFDDYGRKDLPWQKNRTLYHVWISEIMLQQTQVATVLPYYEKFIARFPNISILADTKLDEVLHYWSGLGYYARARNLHKTAQYISTEYSGKFPEDIELLIQLPGIGRSTAGAILAQTLEQPHPILDANVKRVLSRYYAVKGWPGNPKIADILWQHAGELVPKARIADYTQAMMDLGALVCKRNKPICSECPLQKNCQALQLDRIAEIPARKPIRNKPIRSVQMLVISNMQGHYLLKRRPPTGIWGGLLSFPEIASEEPIKEWAENTIGNITVNNTLSAFRHTFSHFHLDITPVIAELHDSRPQIMDDSDWLWYNHTSSIGGIAAPVKKIMQNLQK